MATFAMNVECNPELHLSSNMMLLWDLSNVYFREEGCIMRICLRSIK